MKAPAIQFCLIKNRQEFNRVRSSDQTVRFRVWRRSERVEFDGDWFSSKWELAPAAWKQIEALYDHERRLSPCARGACGGGMSCVILAVPPAWEAMWRKFLGSLLSRPESWLTWNNRRAAFGAQTSGLEAVA